MNGAGWRAPTPNMSSPTHLYDELSRSVERLNRIVEASKLLNSTLDLAELTRIILQIVRDEVGIERGTVFVVSEDGTRLRSLVAQEVDAEIEVKFGSGIAGAVAETGEVIDITDAYSDERFDRSFDAQLDFRTNDIYCMPARNRDGELIGVLQLLNRSRPLTQTDQDFLAGISIHIGLAIENASLHGEIVEKKRLERELDLAREIQEAFYPDLPDSYAGVQIAGSSQMCYEVGGDYLSFFPLNENRFIVMLGDVAGKGIGAALVMTSVHALCRSLVRHVHSLEKMAYTLNEMLLESTQASSYLTLLIMLVDASKDRVHFISAGHNPPVMVDGDGVVHILSGGGGPPVGLLPSIRHSREILDVKPGSVMVIYTDGVSEAENPAQEQFGMDRLSVVVRRNSDRSASEIHDAVRSAIEAFVGTPEEGADRYAHDDSTMMVLRF